MKRNVNYSNYSNNAETKLDSEPQDRAAVREEMPKPVFDIRKGQVTNCQMVNVRQNPKSDAVILDVLQKDTVVDVHLVSSTNEYYSVKVDNGIEGYIKKDYLLLLSEG